jgi:serine/threonine protein kinase
MRPLDDTIKIIDFGGATYDHEQHNSIINTRQYRAPEVILNCEDWTKKSDIWSMVCILIEMYTGELFYQAREEVEHLAMIEKQCGPTPKWMAEQTQQSLRDIFCKESSMVEDYKMRIAWPDAKRRDSSFKSWQKMKTLEQLVQSNYNMHHLEFLNLLKFMMKVDPHERPTARECLNHQFFKMNIPESTL